MGIATVSGNKESEQTTMTVNVATGGQQQTTQAANTADHTTDNGQYRYRNRDTTA